MRRPAAVAAIVLLDLVVLLHLAGGIEAAAMFLAVVAFLVAPALVLARRIAPMPMAAVLVAGAVVPWYFARKLAGASLVFDLVTAALLLAAVVLRRSPGERPFLPPYSLVTFVVLPSVFALVWLGWSVVVGHDVRFYGLFPVDFGNLVSIVGIVRASPLLPLSYVTGTGPLSYHWLFFTFPAALADAFGGSMPNANALVLANLLAAMLFVQAVFASDFGGVKRAAWLVLFAPFTTYFYQVAAARLHLAVLGLPQRNHLLLSPLNSIVTFGNNTIALTMVIAAVVQLDLWNREGRLRDAFLGSLAVALVMGYSITLVFPLTLALIGWVLLGRVRRPAVALSLAAGMGAAVIAVLFALGVLAGDSSRHIVLSFDRGAFLKMVLFGMLPLWVAALVAGRRQLAIQHLLIAACIAVPSLLYIAGSPTGATDFSMKTASLLAVAFAPILVFDGLTPGRRLVIGCFALFGLVQSCAYVFQFPYYRFTHSTHTSSALPGDYVAALDWIRGHTPISAVLVDPHEVANGDAIFSVALGERRVWLPTRYTSSVLIAAPAAGGRLVTWTALAQRHDAAAAAAIAREADVLLVPFPISSPAWSEIHRDGQWLVYASTLHSPR